MGSTIDHNRTKTSPPIPLAELSDEALLTAYRDRNDRSAFSALVHRFEREIYNYLRRYLGDETLAEDAFQATFLQVHLKCGQFDATKRFRPWLYTIAMHQAIDAQRRNKRHRMVSLDRRTESGNEEDLGTLLDLLISQESGPAGAFESAEHRDWVRAQIAALPDPLRSALALVYYQGLKYREAADVLHVPVGTVKSRLHAALLKLGEAWDRDHRSGVN